MDWGFGATDVTRIFASVLAFTVGCLGIFLVKNICFSKSKQLRLRLSLKELKYKASSKDHLEQGCNDVKWAGDLNEHAYDSRKVDSELVYRIDTSKTCVNAGPSRHASTSQVLEDDVVQDQTDSAEKPLVTQSLLPIDKDDNPPETTLLSQNVTIMNNSSVLVTPISRVETLEKNDSASFYDRIQEYQSHLSSENGLRQTNPEILPENDSLTHNTSFSSLDTEPPRSDKLSSDLNLALNDALLAERREVPNYFSIVAESKPSSQNLTFSDASSVRIEAKDEVAPLQDSNAFKTQRKVFWETSPTRSDTTELEHADPFDLASELIIGSIDSEYRKFSNPDLFTTQQNDQELPDSEILKFPIPISSAQVTTTADTVQPISTDTISMEAETTVPQNVETKMEFGDQISPGLTSCLKSSRSKTNNSPSTKGGVRFSTDVFEHYNVSTSQNEPSDDDLASSENLYESSRESSDYNSPEDPGVSLDDKRIPGSPYFDYRQISSSSLSTVSQSFHTQQEESADSTKTDSSESDDSQNLNIDRSTIRQSEDVRDEIHNSNAIILDFMNRTAPLSSCPLFDTAQSTDVEATPRNSLSSVSNSDVEQEKFIICDKARNFYPYLSKTENSDSSENEQRIPLDSENHLLVKDDDYYVLRNNVVINTEEVNSPRSSDETDESLSAVDSVTLTRIQSVNSAVELDDLAHSSMVHESSAPLDEHSNNTNTTDPHIKPYEIELSSGAEDTGLFTSISEQQTPGSDGSENHNNLITVMTDNRVPLIDCEQRSLLPDNGEHPTNADSNLFSLVDNAINEERTGRLLGSLDPGVVSTENQPAPPPTTEDMLDDMGDKLSNPAKPQDFVRDDKETHVELDPNISTIDLGYPDFLGIQKLPIHISTPSKDGHCFDEAEDLSTTVNKTSFKESPGLQDFSPPLQNESPLALNGTGSISLEMETSQLPATDSLGRMKSSPQVHELLPLEMEVEQSSVFNPSECEELPSQGLKLSSTISEGEHVPGELFVPSAKIDQVSVIESFKCDGSSAQVLKQPLALSICENVSEKMEESVMVIDQTHPVTKLNKSVESLSLSDKVEYAHGELEEPILIIDQDSPVSNLRESEEPSPSADELKYISSEMEGPVAMVDHTPPITVSCGSKGSPLSSYKGECTNQGLIEPIIMLDQTPSITNLRDSKESSPSIYEGEGIPGEMKELFVIAEEKPSSTILCDSKGSILLSDKEDLAPGGVNESIVMTDLNHPTPDLRESDESPPLPDEKECTPETMAELTIAIDQTHPVINLHGSNESLSPPDEVYCTLGEVEELMMADQHPPVTNLGDCDESSLLSDVRECTPKTIESPIALMNQTYSVVNSHDCGESPSPPYEGDRSYDDMEEHALITDQTPAVTNMHDYSESPPSLDGGMYTTREKEEPIVSKDQIHPANNTQISRMSSPASDKGVCVFKKTEGPTVIIDQTSPTVNLCESEESSLLFDEGEHAPAKVQGIAVRLAQAYTSNSFESNDLSLQINEVAVEVNNHLSTQNTEDKETGLPLVDKVSFQVQVNEQVPENDMEVHIHDAMGPTVTADDERISSGMNDELIDVESVIVNPSHLEVNRDTVVVSSHLEASQNTVVNSSHLEADDEPSSTNFEQIFTKNKDDGISSSSLMGQILTSDATKDVADDKIYRSKASDLRGVILVDSDLSLGCYEGTRNPEQEQIKLEAIASNEKDYVFEDILPNEDNCLNLVPDQESSGDCAAICQLQISDIREVTSVNNNPSLENCKDIRNPEQEQISFEVIAPNEKTFEGIILNEQDYLHEAYDQEPSGVGPVSAVMNDPLIPIKHDLPESLESSNDMLTVERQYELVGRSDNLAGIDHHQLTSHTDDDSFKLLDGDDKLIHDEKDIDKGVNTGFHLLGTDQVLKSVSGGAATQYEESSKSAGEKFKYDKFLSLELHSSSPCNKSCAKQLEAESEVFEGKYLSHLANEDRTPLHSEQSEIFENEEKSHYDIEQGERVNQEPVDMNGDPGHDIKRHGRFADENISIDSGNKVLQTHEVSEEVTHNFEDAELPEYNQEPIEWVYRGPGLNVHAEEFKHDKEGSSSELLARFLKNIPPNYRLTYNGTTDKTTFEQRSNWSNHNRPRFNRGTGCKDSSEQHYAHDSMDVNPSHDLLGPRPLDEYMDPSMPHPTRSSEFTHTSSTQGRIPNLRRKYKYNNQNNVGNQQRPMGKQPTGAYNYKKFSDYSRPPHRRHSGHQRRNEPKSELEKRYLVQNICLMEDNCLNKHLCGYVHPGDLKK